MAFDTLVAVVKTMLVERCFVSTVVDLEYPMHALLMSRPTVVLGGVFIAALMSTQSACGQESPPKNVVELGPYLYESKPTGEAFEKFNPRLAPKPGPALLRKNDRLAIIGDSITEQKMYSRIIETYLTACHPELAVSVRQYGWSGEKTDGFLKRMQQDLFTGKPAPTIATLAYGMNDARYRPFDFNNGVWYRDHYAAIVQRLKTAGTRVVVGSPGCSGKIAMWVGSRRGTLDEHNLHLCALRDIAIQVAEDEGVGFADMFWPMYVAQAQSAKRYGTTGDPYEVTGNDGIHPGWAGHVMMAHQFLRSMNVLGDLATFRVDVGRSTANASDGHEVRHFDGQTLSLTSHRYPFCATGEKDDDNSIRSGMTLVPFNERFNQFKLIVDGLEHSSAAIRWGESSKTFTRDELSRGVNLADVFEINPFSDAFSRVDQAVAAKQAFETEQIKRVLHGKRGRTDLGAAIRETESERTKFVEQIIASRVPVEHEIVITPVDG